METLKRYGGFSYPNTPLKSTCAYTEFDKFKAKLDNEEPCSDDGKFVYALRTDRRNDIHSTAKLL